MSPIHRWQLEKTRRYCAVCGKWLGTVSPDGGFQARPGFRVHDLTTDEWFCVLHHRWDKKRGGRW